jgi:hypothetical protein
MGGTYHFWYGFSCGRANASPDHKTDHSEQEYAQTTPDGIVPDLITALACTPLFSF